jgi:hypothetical protein
MVSYKKIRVDLVDYIEITFYENYHTILIVSMGKEYRRMFRTLEKAKEHFDMICKGISNNFTII